jgi:tetratricopeptide (TPR) repeat protein
LTGGELEEFVKRGTESPEAFEHYLRGRYHFNSFTEDGFAKAFVSFHSAIAADPDYAHAYAGIADYYNWLGIVGVLPPQDCFQPAIAAATKAIELDDSLSEGHASLGFSLHAGEYDWAKAEYHSDVRSISTRATLTRMFGTRSCCIPRDASMKDSSLHDAVSR